MAALCFRHRIRSGLRDLGLGLLGQNPGGLALGQRFHNDLPDSCNQCRIKLSQRHLTGSDHVLSLPLDFTCFVLGTSGLTLSIERDEDGCRQAIEINFSGLDQVVSDQCSLGQSVTCHVVRLGQKRARHPLERRVCCNSGDREARLVVHVFHVLHVLDHTGHYRHRRDRGAGADVTNADIALRCIRRRTVIVQRHNRACRQ